MNDFKSATEKLKTFIDSTEQAQEYMRDINNWVAVHTTRYMPIASKDGKSAIPTSAMATEFKIPRSTVHTTLNHVVQSHMYGSWTDAPYVLITPFKDVVKENENPLEVSLFDTYFAPNPDTGLVLPPNTRIVMPSDNMRPDELIRIDGNRTYYNGRLDKLADDRVQFLLDKMDSFQRHDYDRWMRGEFDDMETRVALNGVSDAVKKLYNNATDKKAFMRGMFEEDRYAMLSEVLRNFAAEKTIENMGKSVVHDVDIGPIATAVFDTALNAGMPGNASNKGHSASVPMAMEEVWSNYNYVMNGGAGKSRGLGNLANDLDGLYNFISDESNGYNRQFIGRVRQSLVTDTPLDFMSLFNDAYRKATDAGNTQHKMPATLAEYNPNIARTVAQSAARMSRDFDAWRANVARMPGYDAFIARLRQLDASYARAAIDARRNSGRDA